MDPTNTDRAVLLSSGHCMPFIGLGMFLTKDEAEMEVAVTAAVDAGYRHFDTAFTYRNEAFLGSALKAVFASKRAKREELFIVSKLPTNGLHSNDVEYFCRKSLDDLQIEFLDLYLIHFPVAAKRSDDDYAFFPKKEDGSFDGDETVDLVDTWKAMESLVDKGLVKSIGISNFNSQQIQRIYDAARIKPAVLQVECHAYLPQFELHELCKKLKIALTAYSPIGAPGQQEFSSGKEQRLIDDPKLKPLCEKHGKSPAQVLLRYLIQRGIIVIPKSINPKRLQENIQIFDFSLSDEDMEILKSMNKHRRYFPMNTYKGMSDHPEYPFKIPF